MKIGSLNVNGINAFGNTRWDGQAAWKFFEYYAPDVLCLQETKGDLRKVKSAIGPQMNSYSYTPFVSPSKGKPGYAGVAMLFKKEFLDAEPYTMESIELSDFMDESDPLKDQMIFYGTGRILKYESKSRIIVSVYVLNSGGKDDLRKAWDRLFHDWIRSLDFSKDIFILGDFNVCPTKLDMWDWDNSLDKYPGLMSYEIYAFQNLIESTKLVDSFRFLNPELPRYSWAAPKVPLSKGWRLDYALTNRINLVEESSICHERRNCSDHTYIEIKLK